MTLKRLRVKPTEAELGILRVLWSRGPSSVRQVLDEMPEGTGYTTVLKLLQIMSDKGLVEREESERKHIYTAALAEHETQRQLVGDLLEKAFGGSAQKLVLSALSTHKPSAKELSEIRNLLDSLEGK
ncbi:MAG TPA: BlaI/MecI/CopY family transcriptional regulator [Candidatus Limnocylindria bacterium]|jgi:predicted transcriptional regulator|nr:BlaI/MecI/CopY family transcriptional regulator [Candidatus Limnocylindria bacterium]